MEKEISFESKENGKIPEGATILKNTHRISVEEIENGFVIRKNYDVQFKIGDDKDYLYFTKKWFSKTNPLQMKVDKEGEKYLSDNF